MVLKIWVSANPGEAAGFIKDRHTAPGGQLPLNTNGGGLSYMHSGMYGMYAMQESIRQLRGICAGPGCRRQDLRRPWGRRYVLRRRYSNFWQRSGLTLVQNLINQEHRAIYGVGSFRKRFGGKTGIQRRIWIGVFYG